MGKEQNHQMNEKSSDCCSAENWRFTIEQTGCDNEHTVRIHCGVCKKGLHLLYMSCDRFDFDQSLDGRGCEVQLTLHFSGRNSSKIKEGG
jgi:hypothetical protein